MAGWLLVAPRTPDLAGQVYRVELFRALGFGVWDEHWYAGHYLPGYSLLLPPLGALLGVRLLGALCALASVALFERLARRHFGRSARWGACLFALAAVGDIWVGRVAFALGVTFALAAALALGHGRWAAAGVAAAASAVASPVAGALLALGAVSAALGRRDWRIALAPAAPVAAAIGVLALLYPEGGVEPYPLGSFVATAVVVGGYVLALPREQRLLRTGGAIYLLVCVLCLLVRSPMGSNVERYGVLLAGPLLLCARPRASAALVAAVAAWALWIVWGPVRETLAVAGSEATQASYYAPVEHFLARAAKGPVRVEVPLTRSHWEAALLAPSVSLARGWEKQLEERFDGPLLGRDLSAGAYERWLQAQAVSYVALPDAALDPSSAREGELIRSGLPFLQEVFRSRHWRIFRVRAATPLASGPGTLISLGHAGFTLHATAPGRFLLRLRFTRYWTLTRGAGCVAPAPAGWTWLTARSAGAIAVAARFSLARALAPGGSCAGPTAGRARTARSSP